MNAGWRFATLGCGTWALLGAVLALAQAPADIRIDPIPLGGRPAGMEVFFRSSYEIAVANSDTNSVSIFDCCEAKVRRKVEQIPSPYAVVNCDSNEGSVGVPASFKTHMLVTSPSEGLVTWLDYETGTVVSKLRAVARPYSVDCMSSATGPKAVISSYGDDTLVVVDRKSGDVVTRVPGVAASRRLRGVVVTGYRVWVAGTDANLVTVVDLNVNSDINSYRVLARIPVRRPTAIRRSRYLGQVYVASEIDNAILSIDTATLTILPPYLSNVPNPQDVDLGSYIGKFIPGGTLNSVARVSGDGRVTIIPGIPGAASVVSYYPSGSGISDSTTYLSSRAWVTSPDTNSLYYIQPASAVTWPTFSLTNAASFESTTALATFGPAPGSLATMFASTGTTQSFYAFSKPLPTALGGVSISVGGRLDYSLSQGWTYSGGTLASLLFVGPNQINFQVPPGTVPGDIAMQLSGPDGKARQWGLTRATTSWPGIFTFLMNGKGQGAVLNQDNSQNGDPQNFVGVRPASRGSVIQIFATGAGDTTPALAAGEAAPAGGSPLVLTKVQPTVAIGGKNAKVQFSGMAPGFVGLWQINAEIPQDVTPGMALPLVITAGGAQSNTVTIAVQ
jgi:uncharacterized protein (TIGR03437 family)